jgi:hypothetical protein
MMRISILLLLCALALSGIAAYYSIVGLAAIFASAFWPVVVMSTILEVSKLVVTSWLYQKWNIIPGLVKIYLTSAVVILMLITSLGIFGFLSKAHVDQGLSAREITLRLDQIEVDLSRSREILSRYQSQLQQLDRAINIQLDASRAQQAMAARKQQEAERTQIRGKLDAEEQTISSLTSQRTSLRQQLSVIETKVGPIRYVAEFFSQDKNVDLDKTVQYMIMVIVLVFDPLAVLMLIAANMSFVKERSNHGNTDKTQVEESNAREHNGPAIGQTIIDPISNSLIWFNGTAWVPITPQQTSGKVEQGLNQEDIKRTIKDAMDMWLTTVENETQNQSKVQSTTTDESVTVNTNNPVDNTQQTNILQDTIDPSASNLVPKPVGRKWI